MWHIDLNVRIKALTANPHFRDKLIAEIKKKRGVVPVV
jgi:hypothetical protein